MSSTLASAASTGGLAAKYSSLVKAALQLYTADTATQASIVKSHYTDTATFEDPLMIVNGTANIEAQFNSLHKFFSSISVTEGVKSTTTTSASGGVDSTTTPTKPGEETFVVPNTQIYKTKPEKPETVIECNTLLTVDTATSKIVRHHDVWLNKSFENPTVVKKVGGWTSSAIFKLFNVGV
ncbi:hypothetical protein HDU87_001064 [Geranomyces variabilis]|uniref:Uncharacterized protein n=1 Tax=Geranomyces variabilis TaxID=109894 RepID=A0AAD5XST8_9FUNG|nr:hypothetical protein HDU87_001064 [Geranomyces variabilis]